MISGHFDPFTHGHLSYIKQAKGDMLLCVVSSDSQLLMKKGKVNVPEKHRLEIMDIILTGLGLPHVTVLNIWDKDTTLVAEALRFLQPAIFFRGGDKTIEDMPPEERQVCDDLGIKILHAKLEYDVHGANMA